YTIFRTQEQDDFGSLELSARLSMAHHRSIMTEQYTSAWLMALSPGLRAAIEAAAVLELFDAAALGALLQTPAEAFLEDLCARGLIHAQGARYQLEPDLQATALTALREVPSHLHDLYRRAAHYYAARLAVSSEGEHAAVELTYMHF